MLGREFVDHEDRAVTARIALHADRMDGHDPAALGGLQLSGLAGTQAADGQSRSGEWVAVEILIGDAELRADFADLVLIERCKRLDDAAVVDQLLDAGYALVLSLIEVGLGCPPASHGAALNSPL